MFKKISLFVAALLMASAPAMASNVRIDLNGGERRLPECGGTIEAKGGILGGGQTDQVNLIVRDSEYCSNFVLETTGKVYKLQGSNRNRGGSYSITSEKLDLGWNQIRLTVRSNTGAHSDSVAIWVNVVNLDAPVETGARSCFDDVREAARVKYLLDQMRSPRRIDVRFDRISRAGNYVYNVTADGYVLKKYEIVTDRSCNVIN